MFRETGPVALAPPQGQDEDEINLIGWVWSVLENWGRRQEEEELFLVVPKSPDTIYEWYTITLYKL